MRRVSATNEVELISKWETQVDLQDGEELPEDEPDSGKYSVGSDKAKPFRPFLIATDFPQPGIPITTSVTAALRLGVSYLRSGSLVTKWPTSKNHSRLEFEY